MSQAPRELIDGIRRAERIQVAAIDVLRDMAGVAVGASSVVPGGDRWMPVLDRAVADGFQRLTTAVRWQYDMGVRAVEALAPLMPG
jgi:hypothetical protein